ncbi:hypothetical protein THIOM_002284 [Candidatus Thiomargarita nelsonii]|uniref:Uncharacterized protein n=1 Tax=Candidatus Thiomargarita nelsonii TaxID=1003181 RepID=A0A176S1W6_9GAMM|nr:hypothetical protein THIOM_002284 [Candidatus Thiomargarita nelsonii]
MHSCLNWRLNTAYDIDFDSITVGNVALLVFGIKGDFIFTIVNCVMPSACPNVLFFSAKEIKLWES